MFLDILSEKGTLIIWFLFSERRTITQTITKIIQKQPQENPTHVSKEMKYFLALNYYKEKFNGGLPTGQMRVVETVSSIILLSFVHLFTQSSNIYCGATLCHILCQMTKIQQSFLRAHSPESQEDPGPMDLLQKANGSAPPSAVEFVRVSPC